MAVASTASTTSTTTSGAGNSATSKLIQTYDTFLKLLTTQLRVQNPMDPMDAEKFTEQLVQYSSVEQQMKTNDSLNSMLATMVSSTTLSLVNYIGKTISAQSETTQFTGDKARWNMTAAADAKDAEITVRNSAGAVVYSGKADLTKGENTFDWDGKMSGGGTAAKGENYTISVSAKDKDGNAVAITTRTTGVVEGIDTSGAEPYLFVNGTAVPLSSLLKVEATKGGS